MCVAWKKKLTDFCLDLRLPRPAPTGGSAGPLHLDKLDACHALPVLFIPEYYSKPFLPSCPSPKTTRVENSS
jgi:hypothetical protein